MLLRCKIRVCCINILILSGRTPEIISFVPGYNYGGGTDDFCRANAVAPKTLPIIYQDFLL